MSQEKSISKELNTFVRRNSYWLIPGGLGIVVAFLLFACRQWAATKAIKTVLSDVLFAPITGLLSIFVALLTVLLYIRAQKQQRQIAVMSEESAKKINLVYNRISETIGIERYVKLAGEMYQKKGVDRVVTSLQHWMTIGEIEKGIDQSGTKELIIFGRIAWNEYLPGVLWRFIHLREKAKQNSKEGIFQTLRIVHVDPNTQLPLFVVSRIKGEGDNENEDAAKPELLVGNPSEGRTPDNYGIPLGKRSLGQVFFYNFLCDAMLLLLPNANNDGTNAHKYLMSKLKDIPKVQDGLKRLLCCDKSDKLAEFRHRLCSSCPHGRDIWQWVKEELSGTLSKMVQNHDKEREAHLIMEPEKVKDIISKFINELREAKIVKKTLDKDGCVKLDISESLATCDLFLNHVENAST